MTSSPSNLQDLLALHGDLIRACNLRLQDYFAFNQPQQQIANALPLDDVALIRFAMQAKLQLLCPEDFMFNQVCDMLRLRETHADLLQTAGSDFMNGNCAFPVHPPGKLGGFLGQDLVVVTDLGKTNLHAIAEQFNHSENEAVLHGIRCGEFLRLACDRKTRESNRLCRMINIVDLHDVSVFNMNQMMLQSIGKSSKLSEIMNPMLIAQVILVNTPWSISMVMGLLKPFIPSHVVDTLKYCKHHSKDGKTIAQCPFVSQFLDGASNVPTTAGGLFESNAAPSAHQTLV